MEDLSKFLGSEKKQGKIIYPPIDKIFRAFDLTSFNTVRVVILGQDPYHGQNQANGLSFSVELGIPTPPSLRNIYKELKNDLGIEPPNHGNLEHWAREGVLLLNTCLTVENGIANSHQGQGWEIFTDAVLSVINAEKLNIIFVLWGRKAQKKKKFIDISKHLIIESAHPSPLSAHNGFFGSKPFSKINRYLSANDLPPINWNF
tara:strand:- start:2003 stop:2611 length:609 start_codon:yes stop_codon:yes gene_type:complete